MAAQAGCPRCMPARPQHCEGGATCSHPWQNSEYKLTNKQISRKMKTNKTNKSQFRIFVEWNYY